jgi:uncharacterized protein
MAEQLVLQKRKTIMWKRTLIGLVLLYCAACLAVGFTLTRFALNPPRRTAPNVPLPDFESVSIKANDGTILRGFFGLASGPDPKSPLLILLHGQADHAWSQLSTARGLMENGYSVLAPDARAHGKSGGEQATYGLKEVGDLEAWRRRFSEFPQVALIGVSMGGAISLQAIHSQLPICAVIAESAFSSFREVAYDTAALPFGGNNWMRILLMPSVDVSMWWMRWRSDFDFDSVSAERAVARRQVPILLIHPEGDHRIPSWHAQRILKSARASGTPAELWSPAVEGHGRVVGTVGAEWLQRVTTKLGSSCRGAL